MPALTITDFVLTGVGKPGQYVQLRENATPTNIFTSANPTDSNGQFSIGGSPPPPADYSAYTSPLLGAGAIWTLYDPHFRIGYTRGDTILAAVQAITEATLVAGLDASLGEVVTVTLTADRVVGLPINPAIGQTLELIITQGGAGNFRLTWPAGIKTAWRPAAAAGAISSLTLRYYGTNWQQKAGQIAVSDTGVAAHAGPMVVGSLTVRDPASASPYAPSAGGPGTIVAPNLQGLIHTQQRFVAIGDSITASNAVLTGVQMPYTTANGSAQQYGPCHASMGMGATMGQLILTGIFGAAGKKTTDVLSTYLPQVLALTPRPGYAVVLIGTNDAAALTTTAAYGVNIASIAAQLRNVGIEPIFGTIPPNSGGVAAQDKLIREYNDFLQRFCAYNGMQLLDFFKLLVDPATGGYRSGYNSDVTHPGPLGVWTMATAYRGLKLPNFTPWLSSDTADAHNLLPNGTFAGAGPVATSWNVYSAGVGYTDSTISGDPGIVGQWQQTVGSAASVGSLHYLNRNLSSGFSPGDVLAFSCLMAQFNTGNSGSARYGDVGFQFNGGSGGYVKAILNMAVDFGPIMLYVEVIVPTGSTNLDMFLVTRDQMTCRWAQATLVNLTTAGIASIAQGVS